MKNNNLKYPIIAFSSSGLHIARTEEDILICSSLALKRGFYKSMNIVDSEGFLYKIEDAKKIKGHGIFGGYNIFFNQKIIVELIIRDKPIECSVEEVKRKLNKELKKGIWDSADNTQDIIAKIEGLNKIDEIIHYMAKIFYS